MEPGGAQMEPKWSRVEFKWSSNRAQWSSNRFGNRSHLTDVLFRFRTRRGIPTAVLYRFGSRVGFTDPHAGDIVRPACEKRRWQALHGGMIQKKRYTMRQAPSLPRAGPRWWGVRQRGSIRTPGGLGRSPPLLGGSPTSPLGGSVVRCIVTVKLRVRPDFDRHSAEKA